MSDWINVKDRLPIITCDVMIKTKVDYAPIEYEWVEGIGWYDGWGGQEMGERNRCITHWMELPDYPKDIK